MSIILDGKALQKKQINQLKPLIASLKRPPKLCAILVGNNPASKRYLRHKAEACNKVGIASEIIELKSSSSTIDVKKVIESCSSDDRVDGILLQLPLAGQSQKALIDSILPSKDVDGLTPINMGKLLLGREDGIVPCTPKGILALLKEYQIKTKGKNIVVIGRSNIVGKPLASLLLQKHSGNATVTIAHSATIQLKQICKQADILIAALGRPYFIKRDFIKPQAVVIDVGVNEYVEENKMKVIGDVDPLGQRAASFYSPVPGGVGPMTIAALLENTYLAYLKRREK